MALIGKIRNNPLIVLLFIGGGIALFILSEMTSGANGPIGPVEQIIGRVGHQEIDRTEFEQTLNGAFNGGDAYENRDNLWEYYLNEGVIANEAEAIGLTVSADEIEDLEFGPNPSPVVRRNLTDPQTGQLNTTILNQIKGHIDAGTIDEGIDNNELNPNIRTIWRYQRRNIVTTRLQEKMNALVSKAMYAPSWQAQEFADAQLGNRKVAVVNIPYEDITYENKKVSDADIQAYIDENRSLFDNPEETRTLSYVTFDVEPTEADLAKMREELSTVAADWNDETTAAGDSLFAVANGGNYSGRYVTRTNLSDEVATQVFGDMPTGTVYGPYEEAGDMRLVKLIDRVEMADSAKVRQILIGARTLDAMNTANETIDSLKTVLERDPRKFSDLAAEFSTDFATKDEGGVIEKVLPNTGFRAFEDVVFRKGELGKLYKVRTPQGVHLVEVMSRFRTTSPRVKLAYVVEPIVPSSETEDNRLQEAQQFLNGKSKLADLKSAGMEVTTTNPLRMSTYSLPDLGTGQEVKDIMCWAFSADAGDVSGRVYRFTDPELFYENKYIVVGLDEVIPAGITPVAAVREAVTPQVRNRVTGKKLETELKGMSLAEAAAKYSVPIDTVTSNPSLNSLPNVGAEPKVIAAAATAKIGQPVTVVGNSGVFLISATTDASAGTSGSLPAARQQINGRMRGQAISGILPALRLGAEIEDERASADCQ